MPRNKSQERTAGTEAAYLRRHQNMQKAALKEIGGRALTVQAYVRWLIDVKRVGLLPNSWRQVRCAARAGLETTAKAHPKMREAVAAAIDRLASAKPSPPPAGESPSRTSHGKAKRLSELARICARVISGRSRNARALVHFLRASDVTGLRPCEWHDAILRRLDCGPYEWELRVVNAKGTNGRSHGVYRHLRWQTLPPSRVQDIQETIAEAGRQSGAGKYKTWLATLGSLMYRNVRTLFPRRSKFATLYSARHEAAARWKKFYMQSATSAEELERGAAIVAALLGQASDATATTCYGRTNSVSGVSLIPRADEEEVARVRKRLIARRLKLAGFHENRATRSLEQ